MDPGASHEASSAGQTQPIIPAAVDEADVIPLTQEEPEPIDPEHAQPPGSDTAAQMGIAPDGSKPMLPQDGVSLFSRPGLRRDASIPQGQQLPPAPQPPQSGGHPTDSLSLAQLKTLMADMPRTESMPYAFEYSDASNFAEEIEEWFSYSLEERAMVLKAQTSFAQEWGAQNGFVFSAGPESGGTGTDWTISGAPERKAFITQLLDGLEKPNVTTRLRKAEALVYLALGCWHETAGLPVSDEKEADTLEDGDSGHARSGKQIEWMTTNLEMIRECNGISKIYKNTRTSCYREWYDPHPRYYESDRD
jgi:hypothetical protein